MVCDVQDVQLPDARQKNTNPVNTNKSIFQYYAYIPELQESLQFMSILKATCRTGYVHIRKDFTTENNLQNLTLQIFVFKSISVSVSRRTVYILFIKSTISIILMMKFQLSLFPTSFTVK